MKKFAKSLFKVNPLIAVDHLNQQMSHSGKRKKILEELLKMSIEKGDWYYSKKIAREIGREMSQKELKKIFDFAWKSKSWENCRRSIKWIKSPKYRVLAKKLYDRYKKLFGEEGLPKSREEFFTAIKQRV